MSCGALALRLFNSCECIANNFKLLHFTVEVLANVCIIDCKMKQGDTIVSIDTLTDKIKMEIESGNFKLQAVFDRNIQAIEKLKNEGYSYKAIYSYLDAYLKEKHFRDLIFRAKKKQANSAPGSAASKQQKISQPVQPEKANQIEGSATGVVAETGTFSKKDWMKAGVRKENLIDQLNDTDLTPEIVSGWNCANEMQITKRLTEYLMKQK